MGRRSVTSLIGRLSDGVARTARRLGGRARELATVLDGLSDARRRELAEELGYVVDDSPAPADPARSPEPAVTGGRAPTDEPVTPGAHVDGAEPGFIGALDLEAIDPPPPRGAVLLGPERDGPIHAVAERIFEGPSDGRAERLAIEDDAADAPEGSIEDPVVEVEEDEPARRPEPRIDPSDL